MRVLDELLGIGAGNEPRPLTARIDPSSIRGYYIDLSYKTAASPNASDQLPPAGLAQLALGWHERALDGDAAATARFNEVCLVLARRGTPAVDGLRWPYLTAVLNYKLRPPWFSAMAQGLVASVFVRAFLANGDRRWQGLAHAAIRPLLVEDESDLVALLPAGPVLEEVSGKPRAHILNGWVFALWGLWDVHVGLGEAEAGERFRDSANALAGILDRYDVGWWTRYSLYPHPLADLAKPFYHRLHVAQMQAMGTSLVGLSLTAPRSDGTRTTTDGIVHVHSVRNLSSGYRDPRAGDEGPGRHEHVSDFRRTVVG